MTVDTAISLVALVATVRAWILFRTENRNTDNTVEHFY